MNVLFICKGNWFRSQMAATIYNKLTQTTDAISAGTYVGAPDEPEGLILSDLYKGSPYFFEVMELNRMDVRGNKTVKLTPGMLEQANIVVSMAEEPFIPEFLKKDKKVMWWDIENPKVVTWEIAENTYQKVSKLVHKLVSRERSRRVI